MRDVPKGTGGVRMTEKEKMLAGEIYDANYDENLIKERMVAKDKCFELNNMKPSDFENRKALLKEILGNKEV